MASQAAAVRRQRAGVRVDTQKSSWTGWTELVVTAPPAAAAAAALGLHCYGLAVQGVTVNGLAANFEVVQPVREELPQSVTSAAYDSPQRQVAAVAEAAHYLYERQLQRERQPELSIRLPQEVQQQLQQQGGAAAARGKGGSSGSGDTELRIRVEFSGGVAAGTGAGPSTGLHFWQQYAATNAQVRRTSGWLPCVDSPGAAVQWEGLEVMVRADEVAVGPGQLQRQTWADSERQWRSFHYSLPVACPPCQLGFAVGPFRMAASSLPAAKDGSGGAGAAENGPAAAGAGSSADAASQGDPQLTSFAPQQPPAELAVAAVLAAKPSIAPANGSSAATDGLARSAHFTGLVWRLFEEVLGTRCPLPALQQAFLPPELLLSVAGQVGQGLQLLSASQLIQPRAIEQSIAARCAIARCLARQWFGVLLRAATPLDEWLVEGLSGWLEEQFVRRYLGRNELAYKRWRERQAIFLADNGEAPPLAVRGVSVPSSWGPLFGTERFDPSHLWATKAVAVVAMLEKRAGEELFRKHVSTVVAAGLAALAAEQAAAAGKEAPAASAGAAGAAAAAAAAGGAAAQGDGGAGAAAAGSRLLDTMAFLNDLGRAGSFRREMAPFAARWVYGRGVPHVTAGYVYHRGLSVLELALKQTGPACVKRAADYAQRAAAAEGSNAGIIKAVVREGEQYMDHPVHLGGEAFVLTELKVTPIVEKKQPGRRGRKKKDGEEGEEESTAVVPEDPVRWVRLDPAGEQLIDFKLLQPERQLVAQLLHSRDVVAQAEAIQRLGELAISSAPMARSVGLEALRHTLADRSAFYRVRCDAALALAALRDDQGQAAGLPTLLEYYRSSYFLPTSDGSDPVTPQSIAVSDPSEYFVAQAVVTAISLCREPDGSTRDDVVLFLCACLNDFSSIPGAPFSDYGLVAAMCSALGNLNFEGFGDALLTLLEKFLERDAVLVSPGSSVGCACLAAMAALCANGTCDADEAARVATAVRRVRQSPGLPVALRHAAMAAALQMAAAQRGAEGALQLALAGVAAAPGLALPGQAAVAPLLQLPSVGTPAFLLEEAVQLVAAASAAAAPSAEAAAAFEPAGDEESGGAQPLPLALPLLEQLAALLSAGQDCRLRHLAFVLLQLLAAQPPTVYRPPPTEEAEDAALLAAGGPAVAGQAVSMGATHRTGQQQASGAVAAAAAAAAPKIRLQLGGGGGGGAGGARSMAVSGASGPALSGEGPAMSDARARADGAVEQPVPPAAQGQVFSPARQPGGEADDASSRWPQQQGVAPGQQSQQAAAPAAAPKFKLKIAGGPGQPEAAAAAPAAPAAAAGAPQQLSLLELAQQVQQAQREGVQQPAWNAAPPARKRKTPEPAPAPAAQPAWQQPPAAQPQARAAWQAQAQQAQQQQQQQAYPGMSPSPFGLPGGGIAAAAVAPAVAPSADWFLPQQPGSTAAAAAAAAGQPAAFPPGAAPPAGAAPAAAAGPAGAAPAPKKITKIKLKLK